MFAHRTLIHFPSAEDVAEPLLQRSPQQYNCNTFPILVHPYSNVQEVPNILLYLRYTILKPRVTCY